MKSFAFFNLITTTMLIAATFLTTSPVQAQPCIFPVPDPAATGILQRPTNTYPSAEHNFVHSGTHLQGVRDYEKWAGGLIHTPAPSVVSPTNFQFMGGAVVVDNPDQTQGMTATINYRDHMGIIVGTTIRPIAAEGHYIEAATPLAASRGVGSAQVTVSADDPPLTGASLQTTGVFQLPSNNGTLNFVDGDILRPGATSFQQLQQIQQDSTELWWHFPVSWNAPVDKFTSINAPWYHVINPTNSFNEVRIELIIHDRIAGVSLAPILWRQVILQPFGSLTDITGLHLNDLLPWATGPFPLTGLYETIGNTLMNNPGIDWDVAVHITSNWGLPILGDGFMADLIAPYAEQQLGPYQGNGDNAIRMASTMLQSTPRAFVSSPEFSYSLTAPDTGLQQTTVSFFNPGNVAIPSFTYEYICLS